MLVISEVWFCSLFPFCFEKENSRPPSEEQGEPGYMERSLKVPKEGAAVLAKLKGLEKQKKNE